MKDKNKMLSFKEMNDLYRHVNVPVQTSNPNLHIYKFSDFTKESMQSIGPHTKDFYQISFIQKFGRSQLNINDRRVNNLNNVLYFISPNHIYSWVRDQKIDGFILNFKQEYLAIPPETFQQRFTFFELDKLNAIPIDTKDKESVIDVFEAFYSEYHFHRSLFSEEILKHYVQVVLYKCLNMYKRREEIVEESPQNKGLFIKYQNLINNYYLSRRTVKEYAALLHISPNHLSESIKSSTGKNALYYINKRLLLEAKNLLTYSHEDIKQIAYTLNFASPSHFGKFFKKHTLKTPAMYRKEQQSEK